MDLPAEILSLTLRLLQKRDLKNVRHVSKIWEKAAVPHLFDAVFLSPNMGDADIAEQMIEHFGCHIKTLTFSAVYYKAMTWTKFKREAKRQAPGPWTPHLREHLHYAYDNYCRVRSDQMRLLENGVCLALFCRALRRLPHLQKIVLKDLGSAPFLPIDKPYCDGIASSLTPCSVTGCQLSQSEHLDLLLRPESGFLHAAANSWNLAMLAWWVVGSPIRELAVESRGAYLPLRSFVNNTVERPHEVGPLFQSLTKIRLDLLIDPGSGNEMDACCFQEGDVSHALSSAKNLQCLYIRAKIGNHLDAYKPMTPFQSILGTCQFPALRSLIFNSIDSTLEELIKFLGASSQLQQLTLVHYDLLSGTWKQAAEWMRRSLRLEEVVLDELYGGWEPDGPVMEFHCGEYKDHFGRVRDFFLRHGPNPFGEEALAAQEEDLNQGLAEGRYQRYH